MLLSCRDGLTRFLDQLNRPLIHADHWMHGIVRLFVGFEHLFDVGNVLSIGFWWNHSVFDFLLVGHAVSFIVRLTVLRLKVSATASSTTLRACCRNDQLA